jgi:hypothetical protein
MGFHRRNIKVHRVINKGRPAVKIKNHCIKKPNKAKITVQQKRDNIVRAVKGSKPVIINRNGKTYVDPKINSIKNVGVGRILVMIACGPSVKEVDFSFTEHPLVDVMVINKPYKPVWPSKYWAFCDDSQRNRNLDEFKSYKGIIINSNGVRENIGQIVIKMKHGKSFSHNLNDGYVVGRSSVYANMQVAQWMNYDKIFIFGVDMAEVGGKLHHYGVNPDVKPEIRKTRFANEATYYDKMAEELPESIKKKFYFCSSYNPFEFVSKFNKLDHKMAVEFITEMLVSERYEAT